MFHPVPLFLCNKECWHAALNSFYFAVWFTKQYMEDIFHVLSIPVPLAQVYIWNVTSGTQKPTRSVRVFLRLREMQQLTLTNCRIIPEKSIGPWCDLQAAVFVLNQFLPATLNLSRWHRVPIFSRTYWSTWNDDIALGV